MSALERKIRPAAARHLPRNQHAYNDTGMDNSQTVSRDLVYSALLAGAGLAAAAAGGPLWGIVGLLAGGAAGNEFHEAIKGARDWYAEWTSGPDGVARNFDITALAARAILGIASKAAEDFKGDRHGRGMARAIADLGTEHWESALRSPGFETLGDKQLVQLTGLHHGGINDQTATRSVWAELIKAALLAANAKASVITLTPKQVDGLSFTARRLWERFAVQFNGELRSDPKNGGRALVAVQLLLANRSREEVARIDEAVRTGTTTIVHALDEAAGRLRNRLKRLEEKHDAHEKAESQRHAILSQQVCDVSDSVASLNLSAGALVPVHSPHDAVSHTSPQAAFAEWYLAAQVKPSLYKGRSASGIVHMWKFGNILKADTKGGVLPSMWSHLLVPEFGGRVWLEVPEVRSSRTVVGFASPSVYKELAVRGQSAMWFVELHCLGHWTMPKDAWYKELSGGASPRVVAMLVERAAYIREITREEYDQLEKEEFDPD